MIDYIKRHERYTEEMLAGNPGPETLSELLGYHDKQISWMQHERMAHLITMLFVCLFFLLAFGFTIIHFALPCISACGAAAHPVGGLHSPLLSARKQRAALVCLVQPDKSESTSAEIVGECFKTPEIR